MPTTFPACSLCSHALSQITWAVIEFMQPCLESAFLPWLTIDVVAIKDDGLLYINGVPQREDYIAEKPE